MLEFLQRRGTLLLGTFTYGIMMVWSLEFYQERIAYIDASYILFKILSEGELAIQAYRFGSAITQVVPLIGSWLDLSLETIMKLYSVCFPIYFYSLFLICLLYLKKEKYALLLVLFNVGMVTHTFYWATPEFQQGLALLIFYFAFLEKGETTNWLKQPPLLILHLFLLGTLAFFHPLMIFPFVFFVSYLLFFTKIRKTNLFLSGAIFLGWFMVKLLFFKTTYDNNAIGTFGNIIELFPDYFSIRSNINFLGYLTKDYYLLIVALLLLLFYGFTSKRYWPVIFSIIYFLGFLFVVNISFANGWAQFHLESLYLPLSLILFFPLIYDFFPRLNLKYLYFGLLVVIIIRLSHIYQTRTFYVERVSYIKSLIEKTDDLPQKKVILQSSQIDKKKMKLAWALSFETWLLSTIEENESRSIVVIDNAKDKPWRTDKNKALVAQFGVYPYDNLSEPYFYFKDTTQYVVYPPLQE